MRLSGHLSVGNPESMLWRARGVGVTRGDVLRYLGSIKESVGHHLDAKVALYGASDRQLLLALAALDGIAEQILILPSGTEDELVRSYVSQVGCTRLVYAGEGSPPEGWEALVDWNDLAHTKREPVSGNGCCIDTRWIIPTSGTTGVPKLVGHTLSSLCRSLKTEKSAGGGIVWGLLYDPARFAGLQVFLQALCGGSALLIPRDRGNLEMLAAELAEAGCNALSATPSMWRKLLMTDGLRKLDMRYLSLGGEIADQPILSALTAAYPSSRITHIYASTEAGVGFAIKDGRAGFPATYLSEPPPGMRIRVDDEGFLLLKPERCEQQYIGRDEQVSNDSGWINTGDLVSRKGDRFCFLGRANGAINIGGRKVLPQEVEAVVLEVPGVALAQAVGRNSSILGSVVAVEVVASPGEDPVGLRRAVIQACNERLEDFKRPVVVRIVEKIEVTAAGKLARS